MKSKLGPMNYRRKFFKQMRFTQRYISIIYVKILSIKKSNSCFPGIYYLRVINLETLLWDCILNMDFATRNGD